jgi:predicted CoA-binding protein
MPLLESDSQLRQLLAEARTIAVVGLSDHPGRDSHLIARFLQARGYAVIPVNPLLPAVLGLRAFPDLESIGHPVDIVNVFRRPEHVPAIAAAAVRAGARALWMQPGTVHQEATTVALAGGLEVAEGLCIMVQHLRLLQ